MKSEEIKMKTINNNLVIVLFTFKLEISLVKKTVCGYDYIGKTRL